MKRFAWWLFTFLFYCYAVSTDLFEGAPAKGLVITACGLAVLLWPVLLFVGDIRRGMRR